MINLNCIGNKLGLIGVVGVLLAAGMIAKQMASEVAVYAANLHADNQQMIASKAFKSHGP